MTSANTATEPTDPLARLQALRGDAVRPIPSRPETWRIGTLDVEQRAAVQAAEGPTVIFGGPGTGKTHTMRERALDMVRRGASPETVTILSYSGYTAGVLRKEINEAVGGECQALGFFVGTFHRLCTHLLRRHGASAAGIRSNFTIWDSDTAKQAMSQMLNGYGNRPGVIAQMADQDEMVTKLTDGEITRLWNWHSHNRNNGPERQREAADPRWPDFAALYQREKLSQNAVDFDDMIHLAISALNNENVKQRYSRGRTRHLFVDEFQDLGTNHYELLRLLAGPTDSITIVCDPNQSIYAWRGADSNLLERFTLDYPKCSQHMLSVNHRSAANIVKLTQAFNQSPDFAGLTRDFQRAIRPPGENIRILNTARTPQNQYTEVVNEIKRLVENGMSYTDIGIIYRSGRTASRLAPRLESQNVPYFVQNAGPARRSRTMSCTVAMLELVVNPWNTMALSLAGNTDPERSATQRINTSVAAEVRNLADQEGVNLVTAAAMAMENYVPETPVHQQLQHVVETYDALETLLVNSEPPATPESMLDAAYRALVRRSTPGSVPATDTSLDQTRSLARRFTEDTIAVKPDSDPRNLLSGFVELLTEGGQVQQIDPDNNPETALPRGVTLSTIHASKGRQFTCVFFVDLNDNAIPGEKVRDQSPALYEEQRLFYVGISRALNLLYLCYSQEDDTGKVTPPSRLLNILTAPRSNEE